LSIGRGDQSDASLKTVDAFVPALRELGYTEGQNIAFDRRFADGDVEKLGRLAHEMVENRVNAIVALSTPAVRAARQATVTIPIIGIGMADPVEDGLASSLARPGGNVTGTTFLGPELLSKRLQLLKEIVPDLSRAVVLWHPGAYGERTMAGMLKEIETAQSMGAKLHLVPAAGPAELDSAFTAMTSEPADGLIVFPSPMLFSQYSRIVTLRCMPRGKEWNWEVWPPMGLISLICPARPRSIWIESSKAQHRKRTLGRSVWVDRWPIFGRPHGGTKFLIGIICGIDPEVLAWRDAGHAVDRLDRG
jgi:putative ABC transport system substrate-binding protein